METETDTDTEEARSLDQLDGRAERRETVKEKRRWEVWLRLKTGEWRRSADHETEEAAKADMESTIKAYGDSWKRWLAVVEVVAVARTQTVTTRTVCSPNDPSSATGTEPPREGGKP